MPYQGCLVSDGESILQTDQRQMWTAGVLLAWVALLGTGLLSGTERHSAPYIAANERQTLLNSLRVVIPADSFDNDILADVTEISDPELLGMDEPTRVYRARWRGGDRAVAFRLVAPDGYSGAIRLLMAVRADGVVSGVRVIGHRETPGLGDTIEARRSDWILGFTGLSRTDPHDAAWGVKRDGGHFDQFTGATITPRAVVKAVHNGLLFFDRHRAQLFNADIPTGTTAIPTQEDTGHG